MKRYNIGSVTCVGGVIVSSVGESENGEFVKFEDVRQKLDMFEEMASFIENECIDFDVCSDEDCKLCRAHGSCSTEIAMRIISRARALQEAGK